jgi:hypothetical protein
VRGHAFGVPSHPLLAGAQIAGSGAVPWVALIWAPPISTTSGGERGWRPDRYTQAGWPIRCRSDIAIQGTFDSHQFCRRRNRAPERICVSRRPRLRCFRARGRGASPRKHERTCLGRWVGWGSVSRSCRPAVEAGRRDKFRRVTAVPVFDFAAFFAAFDAGRRDRGLSWYEFAGELWQQSSELNSHRSDHPL